MLGGFTLAAWAAATASPASPSTATRRFLFRAVGPTLADYGVTNVLTDPLLELYFAGSSRPVLSNDNWSPRAHPQPSKPRSPASPYPSARKTPPS